MSEPDIPLMTSLQLNLDQPLDLAATLGNGQSFRWRSDPTGWYSGVIGRNVVHLRIRGNYTLDIHGGPATANELTSIVLNYFRFDDDLNKIQQTICVDDHIAWAIDQYSGMRLLRQDPWETLICFICSSVSNIPRISRTAESLAQSYGEPICADNSVRHAFPSPLKMEAAGALELRKLGLGMRAPYVSAAAKAVANKELVLSTLRDMRLPEARDVLMSLPGVGPKIADCVLLFSLEKLDAFPIDRWVHRALTEWYLPGKRLNYTQMNSWALNHFGQYAGYAQMYLFHKRRIG